MSPQAKSTHNLHSNTQTKNEPGKYSHQILMIWAYVPSALIQLIALSHIYTTGIASMQLDKAVGHAQHCTAVHGNLQVRTHTHTHTDTHTHTHTLKIR